MKLWPDKISDSKMATWRSAIALLYADHHLHENEKETFYRMIEDLPFSTKQRAQLDADIKNGVNLDDVLFDIMDMRDRLHLINISRVLFYADGEFSEDERQVYEKIKSAHAGDVDITKALNEAREQAFKEMDEFQLDQMAKQKDLPVLQRLTVYLTDFLWRD